MTKKISFQYFDGCPNSTRTLKNIQELLNESNLIDCELEVIEVPNPEQAQELNFQGSPTVLLNGVDIYTEQVPDSFSYSCRIFNIEGKKSGVLTKDYLQRKLMKLGLNMSKKI